MSLHYIIDGYNVVKQVTPWRDMVLSQAREAFLKFLSLNRMMGKGNNKITVIFDGREDIFSLSIYSDVYPGIRVIFSSGVCADEAIIKTLKNSLRPKDVVLVSDDRSLRLSSRAYGAQLMSVKEFLARRNKDEIAVVNDGCVKLSILQEKEINEELRKIWLKEKK